MAAAPKPRKAAGSSRQQARASRAKQQHAAAGASTQAAKRTGSRQKRGIYVSGIFPADVELAARVPG